MRFLCENTLNKIGHLCWGHIEWSFTDEKGKALIEKQHTVCFAGVSSMKAKSTVEKCKYFNLYLKDMVEEMFEKHTKYASQLAPKYLNIIKKLGLFRSVVSYEKGEDGIYVFVFDITKTSMREIFFVGCMLRMISEHPGYVYNFLKLRHTFKEVKDDGVLLCAAAFTKMWSNARLTSAHSHVMCHNGYMKKTFQEFLEDIDKEKWPIAAKHLDYLRKPGHSLYDYLSVRMFANTRTYSDGKIVKPCLELVLSVRSQEDFLLFRGKLARNEYEFYPRREF